MSLRMTAALLLAGLPALAAAGAEPTPAEAAGRIRLVMLGDSVTLSSRAPEGQKLRDCTEKALNALSGGRPAWTVLNRGVGGETSEAARNRLAAVLNADKPHYLTVAYGLNDARHKDPARFRESMRQLIEAVGKRPSPPRLVLLTATPFVDARHQWGRDEFFVKAGGLDRFLDRDLNGATRVLAAEKDLPLCDLHRHMLADARWQTLVRDDGVHLMPAGNERAAAHIAACLHAVHGARALRQAGPAAAEEKARALAAKARKALEAAPGRAPAEAADALRQARELCPYLPETGALQDRLDAAGGAGAGK